MQIQGTILLFLSVLVALALFLLAIFVLWRNPKSKTNLFFSIFCFTVTLWTVANYFSLSVVSPSLMLFWIRVVMALAVILSILFLLFINTFPSSKIQLSNKKLFSLIFLGILTIIICFTPLLFKSLKLVDGQRTPVPGLGISVFIIVAIGSIIYGFILLVIKFRKSIGLRKAQLRYLLVGFLLMFLLVLIFNFAFVVFFDNPSFISLGPIFSLPFIILTTFAIIKHRLMGIRLIIRKGIIYTVTLIVSLIVYVALIFFLQYVIESTTTINAMVINFMAVLIIAIGFEPLRKWLRKIVDNIFFPERKTLQQSLVRIKEELPKKVSIVKLFDITKQEIMKIVPVSNIQFQILDGRKGTYQDLDGNKKTIDLRINSPMIKIMMAQKDVLVREELVIQAEEKSEVEKKELEKIGKILDKYKVALIIPLGLEKPSGLVLCGYKKSKEAFTSDDIIFINTLRTQASIALENALLYKQAVERIRIK
ncbi:MAG: histidine kinase N-terminal 7TM domain-containing protein [Patescibacteria group bacterium]